MRVIKSRMGLTGHVARMEVKRNSYRLVIREPKGKQGFGCVGRRWANIEMDPKRISVSRCGLDSPG